MPTAGSSDLLGPNGAGKTTLIRSVVGLVVPDGGDMQVAGSVDARADAPAARQLVGNAPQEISRTGSSRCAILLALHGRYFGMTRADAV